MKRPGIRLTSWFRRLRRRAALAPRSVRIATVLLAVLTAAGLAWLGVNLAGPKMVPVFDGPLNAEDLIEAQRLLAAEAVAARTESGMLLVPADAVDRARAKLIYEGLAGQESTDGLLQEAAADDLWSTRAQSAKRWQAAKMATLSSLIGMFPPVRNATVLFETGSPRRLGSPAVAPTAAVRVSLRPGADMTDKLVEAIADLVAGSIAGMRREHVCIVDSGGRSYRAAPQPDLTSGPLAARAAAQAHYVRRIRAALPYIPNVVVGVDVAPTAESDYRCTGAWVSVPRDYFESIAASAGGPDGNMAAAVAAGQRRIRQVVMRAIGASDGRAVTVDWHYDTRGQSGDVVGAPSERRETAAVVAAVALPVAAAICLGWIVLGARRRRTGRRAGGSDPLGADDGAGKGAAGALGMLQLIAAEDLLKFLEGEHPQTIAVVLSQLSPEKAAAILSGLATGRQVEVSRRIANIDRIDPETAREVGEELESRLQEMIAGRQAALGGETKLAELLQRVSMATERNVLQSLEATEPALAESLRNRMFAFEDIASMPSVRLRGAFESADGAELALALRVAGKATVRKVFSCLSGPAGKKLRAEIARIGPVRLNDVEAAQQRILTAIKLMEDQQYVPAEAPREAEVLA